MIHDLWFLGISTTEYGPDAEKLVYLTSPTVESLYHGGDNRSRG
jgi:hypothetical protein